MVPSVPNNKLSIYPIEVTIEADGISHKASGLKINDVGMILEVFSSTFSPQQSLLLKWLLPVENIAMEEEAVVIKKYTQNRNGVIIYLMEIHFKKIKFSNSSAILSLLSRFDDAKKQTGKLSVDTPESKKSPKVSEKKPEKKEK